MKLLSIDPGMSIGWAMFDDDRVIQVGTSSSPEWGLWQAFEPDIVIIEFVLSITNSTLGQHLTSLGYELRSRFPNALYVRPGQWKPKMRHVKLPSELAKTTHEHDAVKMGMWWLQRADRS